MHPVLSALRLLLFSGLLIIPVSPLTAAAATTPVLQEHGKLSESHSQQLAQSLVGQCRKTNRWERVYASADLAAERVGDLAPGAQVTLAGNVNEPNFGWIQIRQPVNGYIQAAFLMPCDTSPPPVETMPTAAQILNGTAWRLVRWGMFGNMKQPVANAGITLAFATETRITGSGGCNQYNSPYQGTDHTLGFGPIAATRRACESPISDLEIDYLKALSGVQTYEINDQGQLMMLYLIEGKAGLMVFAPQS
jgi:heat shock protein HslJ